MGLVDEADVVRKPVHPLPVDRYSIGEAIDDYADLCSLYFRLAGNVLVAEQALLHRRHGGGLSLGHVTVAELALHTLFGHVDVMRKRYGLRWGVAQGERRIGKPGNKQHHHHKTDYYCNSRPHQGQGQYFPPWYPHYLIRPLPRVACSSSLYLVAPERRCLFWLTGNAYRFNENLNQVPVPEFLDNQRLAYTQRQYDHRGD